MFKQVAVAFAILLLVSSAAAEVDQGRLHSLVENSIGANSSALVYDLDSQRVIVSKNENKALKPASILKLLITNYALSKLGADLSLIHI